MVTVVDSTESLALTLTLSPIMGNYA